MVNKKIGVYVFLFLLVASLVSFVVSAQQNVNVNATISFTDSPTKILKERCAGKEGGDWFTCAMFSFFAPSSMDEQWPSIIMGLLASAIIFGMLFDISDLVLPFSKWVNYLIAIGFVVGCIILGVVRMIVAWGMNIGSMIAGGAGALAIIWSSVLLVLALVAIFFGGEKLRKFVGKAKQNRRLFDEEMKAHTGAARVAEGFDAAAAAAAAARRAGEASP